MVARSATSPAAPAAAWALIARPGRWPEWSPHVRGAWGLAGPGGEVRAGAVGAARLLGAIPVPARITHVEAGRSWTWRVGGLVEMDHVVEPAAEGEGCVVTVTLAAPGPLEPALAAAYMPLVGVLVRRLAARA